MNSKIKFISTKLKMPTPRKNYIRRAELFDSLKAIEDYKVVLVKGVAGSGKTTLLASFIRENTFVPFKWLTVDSDNNNIFSFWYYFVETVSDYLGNIKNEIASLFDAVLQKDDMDRLIEILINSLDQEKHLVIVIDDFQYIKEETLVRSIEYFIKHMSGNLHLVLLTRDEPGIYLGDLLMRSNMLYIDEAQLKFSREEGTSFLTDSLGLDLSYEVLNEINDMCEGWVGGLQLIALACINRSLKVIKDIKINNKYTVEYLSKEILDSLPEKHRNFLIKTSILGYFNQDICNRLLGIGNSNSIIYELLNRDLFVICIDEEKEVFRYHNVFCEFLKLRFSTLDDEERNRLYQRAAGIYAEIGDIEESIRLLYCNKDYIAMLKSMNLLDQSYKAWSYLARIPVEYLKDNLDYIVQLFFYYYYNSDYKAIELMIEACRTEFADQNIWRFLKIVKSMLIDFELCTELMTVDEIEKIKVSDTTKSILYLKTAAFLFMKFELRNAMVFVEGAARYNNSRNPLINLSILSLMFGIDEELGDLAECKRLSVDMFRALENFKLLNDYKTNYYIGLAGIYIKEFNLEKALECIGIAGKDKEENMYIDAAYLYNLIEIRLLQGNLEEARHLLDKLLLNDAYKNILFMSGAVKLVLFAGYMSQGISDNYKRMYKECDPRFIRVEDTLAYAKVLYWDGDSIQALQLVDEILSVLRHLKIKFKLVEALMFKVKILHNGAQDSPEIQQLLREAIYYSYENRILSPYIYEGQYILQYLTAIKLEKSKDLKSDEKAFLSDIIDLLKKDDSKDGQILSERELEVLCEMAAALTNKQIGEKLCISVATVKTHIINIYSKLNAGNRIEAVELARKMKLIN